MLRFFNAPRSASSLYAALAALMLCLLAPVRPASAQTLISTDTTISALNSPIYDSVRVIASPTGSPTVNLVDSGSIAFSLGAVNTSTVNVSGGTIGGSLFVFGPKARLSVFGTGLSLSELMTDENGDPFVVLSGTLADGTPINERVFLDQGALISQITLIEPFPALSAQVQALGTAGTLSAGNTNALLTKLTAAQNAAASGDVARERDALTAFLNQVKALVRTGKLTAAQGTALTKAAQDILGSLG